MALLDWVSTGIAYSRGKFLEFEDDESNTFNQVDWSTHFYFLNKTSFLFMAIRCWDTIFGNFRQETLM